MESKELWRAFALEKFLQESVDENQLVSGIVDFLSESCLTGLIVTYDAMDNEVDLASLGEHIGPGRLCLTRTPQSSMDLTVHRLDGQQLERHRYGFSQPVVSAPQVPDNEIAVVLVPGILFDQFGTRLGHGQGYYDRFLARLKPSVHMVGITRDVVLAESLPVEAHDVAMTHLATSGGVEPVSSVRN